MTSRSNINPLLLPANVDSPFDDLQGSALLIPPNLKEVKNDETEESYNILGHQPISDIDLNESFGLVNPGSAAAGIQLTSPPATLNIASANEVTPSFAQFPHPRAPIPSVIPPFSRPGISSPPQIPHPFSVSPLPQPSAIPSFPNRPAHSSAITQPFSQLSAPISSVIPPGSAQPPGPPPTFPNFGASAPAPLPPYNPLPAGRLGNTPPSLPLGAIPGGPGVLPHPPPTIDMGRSQSRMNPSAGPAVPSFIGASSAKATPPDIPVGQQSLNILPPGPSGVEAFHTPAKDSVIPGSFENMANNPPSQEGVYHPVMHHWFYAVGQPQVWKPFSFKDSLNLEDAFREGDSKLIPTEGGRYDVNVIERIRKPVYWEEQPSSVRRCSWFCKGPLETQPIPYEEEMAEKLESVYREAVTTGQWHRQVDAKGGDRIMIHSTRTMIHYVGLDGDFASVNSAHSPLSVKRGTEDFDIADGEEDEVDHLLFLVHGIGSVCDLRFRAVEECVDDFRKLGHQLLATHFKQSVDMGMVGRLEILPVSWHKALHGDATGIDNKLKPITLRSIPKLREFTNDTILDVLLFTSPIYCQHIMDTVTSELNRLYNLYCERNPTFKGLVSLGGHSLGSVILFDILMHQSPDSQEESPVTKDEITTFEKPSTESVESPINYVRGGLGTGQPSLIYPTLKFNPEAFFLMGSPFAMFITVRGIDTIDVSYQLPTCKRVFNIFHPFDPVAYRLETLIDPSLTNLRPVLIPHHKGRKRMHLELKETIERVGTEFKQKIVDSIQGTWNRLYQFYSGSSMKSIEQEVDEAFANQLYLDEEDNQGGTGREQGTPVGQLNGGRRIDYVLQEKPYESFNEYIFALQAHVTYWESEDTMLMILKELYGPQGITCDAAHSSQQALPPVQTAYDGDSALGSAVGTPTSPPMYENTGSIPQLGNNSSASSPPPPPVPLFSMDSTNTPVITNLGPTFNYPSTASPSTTPSVIGGRPVVDINSQPRGMDPTAMPGEKKLVGPPPKLPGGTFTRNSPFRR